MTEPARAQRSIDSESVFNIQPSNANVDGQSSQALDTSSIRKELAYESQETHNAKSVIIDGGGGVVTLDESNQTPDLVETHGGQRRLRLQSIEHCSNDVSDQMISCQPGEYLSTPIGVGAASLFSADHNQLPSVDIVSNKKASSDCTSIVDGPSKNIISYEPKANCNDYGNDSDSQS